MKALAIGTVVAGGILLALSAQAADLSRGYHGANAGGVGRLSCAEIASRIQADNGPIGDENNSWKQLQRNPTPQFVLLGITTPDPDHDSYIDGLRNERRALIAEAVAKNCAGE